MLVLIEFEGDDSGKFFSDLGTCPIPGDTAINLYIDGVCVVTVPINCNLLKRVPTAIDILLEDSKAAAILATLIK